MDDLLHGQTKPGLPLQFGFRPQVVSGMNSDTYESGVRFGDTVETIDGKPFTSMRVLYEAVNQRKPGDLLPATVRSAKGTLFRVTIRIPPLTTYVPTLFEWRAQLAVVIGLPAFCLLLGFVATFLRPNDRSAWLLLALMIGFSGLAQEFPIPQWPDQIAMLTWWAFFEWSMGLWATWLVLFALHFPSPTRIDPYLPWLKWILVAPFILSSAVFAAFAVGREVNFTILAFLRPALSFVLALHPDLFFSSGAFLLFFLLVGLRSFTNPSPDRKRRLRILWLGSALSFVPIGIESIRAFQKQTDFSLWASPVEYFAATAPVLLFPLTLGYVVVFRRPITVQHTIRRAARYNWAESGVTFLKSFLAGGAVAAMALLSARLDASFATQMETIVGGLLLIFLLRPCAAWLARRIDRQMDRRSFTVADNVKRRLNTLALRLRTWMRKGVHSRALAKKKSKPVDVPKNTEQRPDDCTSSLPATMEERALIQTLANKISKAQDAPNVTFLLNNGGTLSPVFSTDPNGPPPLVFAESSGVVRHCKVSQKSAAISFDDPANWIQAIHPAEQELLKQTGTVVIVPVSVKDELLGLVALGLRRAEAPYTEHDLQLLDGIAEQAGFELENCRFATQVAQEMTSRKTPERVFLENFRTDPLDD